MVIEKAARVPGNHKNAAGDDYAEYLRKTVEQKIAIKAGQV
jgi:hypothetical protein